MTYKGLTKNPKYIQSGAKSGANILGTLSASLRDKTEYQRTFNVPIAQRWTDLHASSALLATSGIFGDDFDLVSGLNVIVAALEVKSPTSWERKTNLPAALQWLQHASKIIYRDGRSTETWWGCNSKRWTGQGGFSRERWRFWRSILEKSQKDEAIDEEVKQLLKAADVAMERADRAKK
ncbi:hypothetical protein E6O75_ATG03181 [Venturia nashicola]|uniref:Uncharacterized protein n=1 Tax=Venturia nashicola TaxID=86259 RepID=A0A4Z1P604_9PEZI|nr:hypothetical protein E6O75_ATG03181 [Venturia nashicola]